MPKSFKRWGLFIAFSSLLTGCFATASPYGYDSYAYGGPYYRSHAYYAPPAVVVRARPAWGYAPVRVHVHDHHGGRGHRHYR